MLKYSNSHLRYIGFRLRRLPNLDPMEDTDEVDYQNRPVLPYGTRCPVCHSRPWNLQLVISTDPLIGPVRAALFGRSSITSLYPRISHVGSYLFRKKSFVNSMVPDADQIQQTAA